MIAGPCAVESKEQIMAAVEQAKKRHINYLRMNLWKPRTKPGFEGLGEKAIDLLIAAAKQGVDPAAEVLLPEQAALVMDTVLSQVPSARLLLWIGARNQNHHIQREIAKVVARDKRVILMIKNQPWSNEEHWEGIAEHALSGGIDKDHLILCHRGFAPSGDNPDGLRNVPDYEMAMRVKKKTGLPMIFDPSHSGGSVPNVFKVTREAAKHDFDGWLIEVHHDPAQALTDAKQQLTWSELDALMGELKA